MTLSRRTSFSDVIWNMKSWTTVTLAMLRPSPM